MAAAVSGLDLNVPADAETQAALTRSAARQSRPVHQGAEAARLRFRDAMAGFGAPMRRIELPQTPERADVKIFSSEDVDRRATA